MSTTVVFSRRKGKSSNYSFHLDNLLISVARYEAPTDNNMIIQISQADERHSGSSTLIISVLSYAAADMLLYNLLICPACGWGDGINRDM